MAKKTTAKNTAKKDTPKNEESVATANAESEKEETVETPTADGLVQVEQKRVVDESGREAIHTTFVKTEELKEEPVKKDEKSEEGKSDEEKPDEEKPEEEKVDLEEIKKNAHDLIDEYFDTTENTDLNLFLYFVKEKAALAAED